MSLIWSKSRHIDYNSCKRRYFYKYIAAARNPILAELRDQPSPALVRHGIIRSAITAVLSYEDEIDRDVAEHEQVEEGYQKLLELFEDYEANHEITIITECVDNFKARLLPSIDINEIIYLNREDPEQFDCEDLSIFLSIDAIIRWDSEIYVPSWRTGKSRFYSEADSKLKALAAKLFAQEILGLSTIEVTYSDVYLRERCESKELVVTQKEEAELLSSIREQARAYSSSDDISDFPANPVRQICRFCNFRKYCPQSIAN